MKTIDILPEGIRRISGEQEAGAASCDNLINLRNEYNSLKSVGVKEAIESNSKFFAYYEHKLPSSSNFIGLRWWEPYDDEYYGGNDGDENTVIVYDITHREEIYRFKPMDVDFVESGSIDIVFINNLMILNVIQSEALGGQRIVTLVWRDDKYSVFYNGSLPDMPSFDVTMSIHDSSDTILDDTEIEKLVDVDFANREDMIKQAKAMINKLRFKNGDNKTQGAVLISMNYTLYDGSQTKPTPPRLYIANNGKSGDSSIMRLQYYGKTSASMDLEIKLQTSAITVTPNVPSDFYDKNKDIIKSINIYCTRPKELFDLDKVLENESLSFLFEQVFTQTADDNPVFLQLDCTSTNAWTGVPDDEFGARYNATFAKENTTDFDYSNELFYLQKSIPLSDNTSEMNKPVVLTMDDSIFANNIMSVDASGYFTFSGRLEAYNNRIHISNIRRRLKLNSNELHFGTIDGNVPTTAIVYIKTEQQDLKYKFTFNSTVSLNQPVAIFKVKQDNFISFPDSRAYKVEFYFNFQDKIYLSSILLTPSNTHNFAYNSKLGGLEVNLANTYSSSIPDMDLSYIETDTIIVSAQNNPAYFDVSHSYRVQGQISSIAVLTDSVSDLQIGQFPLSIFTSDGIFVLEKGTNNILYSNVSKISDIIAVSKSIQTKTGVYFIAKDGVYNLSGRVATKISDIVEGEPDVDIRNYENYSLCCDNSQTYSAKILPNILDYANKDTILAYDDMRDELFVSYYSSNTLFSYVYSVKTKNWYSVPYMITFAKDNYAVLRRSFSSSKDIVSLNREIFSTYTGNVKQLIHLQTRPLTFGSYNYKNIYRVIQRCEATVGGYNTSDANKNMLSMYIFGSNNLKDWFIIGSTQFDDGYTDKLQIQKVANNYKYFIFVVGGYILGNAILNRLQVMFTEKYSNKLR